MEDSRDLGDLGEVHFSAWCAEVGLIANPAIRDKMGWDFIVEFPFTHEISGLHIHQSTPRCKIQVKATDGQKRKLSVSMANLRKLAVDPYPCFYVFIEFDGSNRPTRAFLRHMDEDLIERILEIAATTANQTFTVHYDESHLLDDLSGKALSNKIKAYLGTDLWNYVEQKKHFLESVGYTDNEFSLDFKVVGDKGLDEMIDLSIGLKKSTQICDITASRKRFGQEEILPKLSSAKAELSMPELKPFAKAKLIFRQGSIANDYRFDVDVYVPNFLIDFSHPKFKARFVASFFEMTVSKAEKTMNFEVDFSSRAFTLAEYRVAFKFLTALKHGNSFKVLLKGELGQDTICKINIDDMPKDYTDMRDTVSTLTRLSQQFKLNAEPIISYDYLEYLKPSAHSLLDFFQGKADKFRICFDVTQGGLTTDNDTVFLGAILYKLGDVILYGLYSAEGLVKSNSLGDKEFCMTAPKVTILNKFTSHQSDPYLPEELHEMLREYERNYSDRVVVILQP